MRYFLILLLSVIFHISWANSIVVYVNATRNLDYYNDGNLFKLEDELTSLRSEFDKNSTTRLILIQVEKDRPRRVKGKFFVIGKGVSTEGEFKTTEALQEIYSENLIGTSDFIYLGHGISSKAYDRILSIPKTHFDTISISACTSAGLKELNVFSKFTRYVLASPVNLHLAGLQVSGLDKTLQGDATAKLKSLLEKSYSKLEKITHSNLILSIYDTDMLTQIGDGSNCIDSKELNTLTIYTKTKLSIYENRNPDHQAFIIKGQCILD